MGIGSKGVSPLSVLVIQEKGADRKAELLSNQPLLKFACIGVNRDLLDFYNCFSPFTPLIE
jgi:hypothetical protein